MNPRISQARQRLDEAVRQYADKRDGLCDSEIAEVGAALKRLSLEFVSDELIDLMRKHEMTAAQYRKLKEMLISFDPE